MPIVSRPPVVDKYSESKNCTVKIGLPAARKLRSPEVGDKPKIKSSAPEGPVAVNL